MKEIKSMSEIIFFLTMVLLLSNLPAQAGERAVNGALFGAGSGALIGQAIGRNTGGTLIGTVVGTMFGYMVGNEMEKNHGVVTIRRTVRTRRWMYRKRPPVSSYREPVCRETRMLATIDGEAQEIWGTACRQDGEWVMAPKQIKISRTIIIKERRRCRHRRYRHHRRSWRYEGY
ncbi:glycine zipper domain-containing protein [Desulfobacterota bacterium M19]